MFIKAIETIDSFKCNRLAQLVELINIPNYYIIITNEFKYSLNSVNPVEYFEEMGCFKILMDICEAVNTMHRNNMICGNIKPSNIVFNHYYEGDEEYFLMDQCKDILYSEGKYPVSNESINYFAPEILKGKETSYSADMWAVGGIMYFILSGKPPFMGNSIKEVKNNILNGNLIRLEDELSNMLNPLIERLLSPQSYSRLTADSLIKALEGIYNLH